MYNHVKNSKIQLKILKKGFKNTKKFIFRTKAAFEINCNSYGV